MQTIRKCTNQIKNTFFQFIFVLHHNSIKNKHLLVCVQFLELISLVYFYFNPIYYQLHNFKLFQQTFDDIWPQLFIVTQSKEFLLSLSLLLIFPAIFISIITMKLIVGYQYLLIATIQIWLLFYPVFFVKFSIQTVNIVLGFQKYRLIGVFVAIFHTIGSLLVLHLQEKKDKMLDFLPIIFIYLNVNSYVVLSFVIARFIASYFISKQTLVKPLRTNIQISFLLILICTYFASDYLTNYISFALVLGTFSFTEIISIIRNYNQKQDVFYYLQDISQQQQSHHSRLKYYDFVENHRISCEDLQCLCRQQAQYKTDQQIKKNGYKFVEKLYQFKEDFSSRIQLGQICCDKYQYTLSGLIKLFSLKPSSLQQEYKLYYVKTKYQQEFRRFDKNYSFGQKYRNAYEQLREFQEKIQDLTKIIKMFWIQILEWDGSNKFLSTIIEISEKITQIKQKYEICVDKYQEFSNQFRYLYKTFEIVILNLLDKDKDDSGYSFGVAKQQINIKVPQRLLFFVSNFQSNVINCNRQFCNLVQTDKSNLINRSYGSFIPKNCSEEHNKWVNQWYTQYNQDQEQKFSIKPIVLNNAYIKAVKMQCKIMPRFNVGIQVITFIKVLNNLKHSLINKATNQTSEINSQPDQNQNDTFFSFLIQKKSMKIIQMDDSFFYTTFIDESQDLRNKILKLRLNQMFPKVILTHKQRQNSSSVNSEYREAMLNYSVLEQFLQCKQKNSSFSANIYNNLSSSKYSPNLAKQSSKSYQRQQIEQQEPLSFARKNKKKLSNFSNLPSNQKPHLKQGGEQIFLYEVIQMKKLSLQVEYCMVNFKLKRNIIFQGQNIIERGKERSKSKAVSSNPVNASPEQQQRPDEQQQAQLLKRQKQQANSNLLVNLTYRQPFIRSSKAYKEVGDQQQVETKKAQLQEADQFSNVTKNYCLFWPILIPLFTIHVIFLNAQKYYGGILTYLNKTFNFYDMYELEILRQLDIKFNNITYTQNLKSLWMEGYGFYHQSILVFQNPSDPYFIAKLYDEAISQNHDGIYRQIQNSLSSQISQLDTLYYLIISILLAFLLYVSIDFFFNLLYCFKISSKVTEIILIFLNISEKDIKNMIYSIEKYQDQVLQMTDFDEISKLKLMDKQDYRLQSPEFLQIAERSGIGLLKQQRFDVFRQSYMKNLQSISNSPIKKDQNSPNTFLNNSPNALSIPGIVPKNTINRKNGGHVRRRSSNVDKIGIQKLKQSMAYLKSSAEDQVIENLNSNSSTPRFLKNSITRKSGFIKTTQNGISQQLQQYSKQNSAFPKDQINQQQNQSMFTQIQIKQEKLKKFKENFRGRLNDMKQNPKAYIFLVVVLMLVAIILICALILIPKFISNLESFSKVYFQLRKLKIVLFKQLIKKVTAIQLQPNVKCSVDSQNFQFIVKSQLNQLPIFQQFWAQIYDNKVCPLVEEKEMIILCNSLNSSLTFFGQKVMFQYLQDYLRRKKPIELFANSLKNPTVFLKISRLQFYLIELGERNLKKEIDKYQSQAQNYQLLIASIGTPLFLICILLSRQSLNDIRAKINDGQNLLLVVPQEIKSKYIEQMKKNRVRQITEELKKQQEKRKKQRRKSKDVSNTIRKKSLGSPQETGTELIANNSSMLNRDQQSLLKANLKNPTETRKSMFGDKISRFSSS